LRTRIVLEAETAKEAEAITRALNPDNSVLPHGMKISVRSKGSDIITEIRFSGRIQTLMSTIDDLLKCAQAADQTLKSLSKTGALPLFIPSDKRF